MAHEIDRRKALKWMLTLPAAASMVWSGSRGGGEVLEFYVAGARYHPPATALQRGDFVELRRMSFRGQPACAVIAGGVRIGFVPRELISRVTASRAEVREVALLRVPWRWYRIAVRSSGPEA